MQLRKYVMAMECDANKSPNCWFGAKSKFWGKSWSEVDQKARAGCCTMTVGPHALSAITTNSCREPAKFG